jgi:hypothetical protein
VLVVPIQRLGNADTLLEVSSMMTVKELKEKLANLPDDATCVVDWDNKGNYALGVSYTDHGERFVLMIEGL